MTPDQIAFARRMARRYGSLSDPAESESRALESVWRASLTWREGAGCTFNTWANWYTRRSLWVLRRSNVRRRAIVADGFDPEWVATPAPDVATLDQGESLRRALEKLPPRQRTAVELVHLQELSHVEAARQMNTTRQTVANLLKPALKKLRRALQVDGAAPFL